MASFRTTPTYKKSISFIRKVFSVFMPKRGNEKPDSNKMVLCFGPDKIYPYQIDFGAAILFSKLKLETPDAFFFLIFVIYCLGYN